MTVRADQPPGPSRREITAGRGTDIRSAGLAPAGNLIARSASHRRIRSSRTSTAPNRRAARAFPTPYQAAGGFSRVKSGRR